MATAKNHHINFPAETVTVKKALVRGKGNQWVARGKRGRPRILCDFPCDI